MNLNTLLCASVAEEQYFHILVQYWDIKLTKLL